jgi:hypothetical protein
MQLRSVQQPSLALYNGKCELLMASSLVAPVCMWLFRFQLILLKGIIKWDVFFLVGISKDY